MHIDYLIIGQGIAGTMLSYFLQKHGASVLVVDEWRDNSATRVAIGTCNPITGNRFVKTWLADQAFPFAKATYRDLEAELKTEIFTEKDIYRVFPSGTNKDKWLRKIMQPDYQDYIRAEDPTEMLSDAIHNPESGVLITQSGFVNTLNLLTNWREKLLAEDRLFETALDVDEVKVKIDSVVWQHISAKKVIFCDGIASAKNMFWRHLPFSLIKGQFLTISAPDLPQDFILKQKPILLPIGENIFKVGATYEPDFIDTNPTKEGRNQLETQLKAFLKVPFKIIDQSAGIRPATADRKPFIGIHPQFESVGIFNGFSSKGLSLAPYFAEQFARYLVNGEEIDEAVQVDKPELRRMRHR